MRRDSLTPCAGRWHSQAGPHSLSPEQQDPCRASFLMCPGAAAAAGPGPAESVTSSRETRPEGQMTDEALAGASSLLVPRGQPWESLSTWGGGGKTHWL